jgi:hypothetical protein
MLNINYSLRGLSNEILDILCDIELEGLSTDALDHVDSIDVDTIVASDRIVDAHDAVNGYWFSEAYSNEGFEDSYFEHDPNCDCDDCDIDCSNGACGKCGLCTIKRSLAASKRK